MPAEISEMSDQTPPIKNPGQNLPQTVHTICEQAGLTNTIEPHGSIALIAGLNEHTHAYARYRDNVRTRIETETDVYRRAHQISDVFDPYPKSFQKMVTGIGVTTVIAASDKSETSNPVYTERNLSKIATLSGCAGLYDPELRHAIAVGEGDSHTLTFGAYLRAIVFSRTHLAPASTITHEITHAGEHTIIHNPSTKPLQRLARRYASFLMPHPPQLVQSYHFALFREIATAISESDFGQSPPRTNEDIMNSIFNYYASYYATLNDNTPLPPERQVQRVINLTKAINGQGHISFRILQRISRAARQIEPQNAVTMDKIESILQEMLIEVADATESTSKLANKADELALDRHTNVIKIFLEEAEKNAPHIWNNPNGFIVNNGFLREGELYRCTFISRTTTSQQRNLLPGERLSVIFNPAFSSTIALARVLGPNYSYRKRQQTNPIARFSEQLSQRLVTEAIELLSPGTIAQLQEKAAFSPFNGTHAGDASEGQVEFELRRILTPTNTSDDRHALMTARKHRHIEYLLGSDPFIFTAGIPKVTYGQLGPFLKNFNIDSSQITAVLQEVDRYPILRTILTRINLSASPETIKTAIHNTIRNYENFIKNWRRIMESPSPQLGHKTEMATTLVAELYKLFALQPLSKTNYETIENAVGLLLYLEILTSNITYANKNS